MINYFYKFEEMNADKKRSSERHESDAVEAESDAVEAESDVVEAESDAVAEEKLKR